MSLTSYPTLITEECPPERTDKHHANLMTRLPPTRAEQARLCVRFLCSAHRTCSLSKTICTALVVCQRASDCRSLFLLPRGGMTGPGDSSVSLSTLSKNVARICTWLTTIVRHPPRMKDSEVVPSDQMPTTFRIPWTYSHDPLRRLSSLEPMNVIHEYFLPTVARLTSLHSWTYCYYCHAIPVILLIALKGSTT